MSASIRIVLLVVAASVAYGVVHDQLTVRLSLEYFTVLHPRIGWLQGSESPTLLGLVWGVRATWWLGFIVGIPVAYACRRGAEPRLGARDLLRPLAIVLGTMGAGAAMAALAARHLGLAGAAELDPALASGIPPDRRIGALMALWAHSASYALGTSGGVALAICVYVARRRRRAGPQPAGSTGRLP